MLARESREKARMRAIRGRTGSSAGHDGREVLVELELHAATPPPARFQPNPEGQKGMKPFQ
jgi:hypothetical protein